MVIVRFRSHSEAKDMLKKVKQMYKFSKELMECLEDKYESEMYEDDEDDVDSEYRNGGQAYGGRREDDNMNMRRVRYRRSM
jgi:hypothetical protein